MRTRRGLSGILAAAVALVLVASGCGTGAAVRPDNAIEVGIPFALTSWDPYLISSSGAATNYLAPVYDTLLASDSNYDIVPRLSTKWNYDASRTTLTMDLRSGVLFHDGTPFDADAAVGSLNRAKRLLTAGAGVNLDSVTSIEKTGPLSIALHLSEPDPTLLGALASFAGMMVSPAAVDSDDLGNRPAGSGPYVPDPTSSSQIKTVLRKFDRYWDPASATAPELIINNMPDDITRLNAFKAGELDVAGLTPTGLQAAKKYQERTDGVKLYTYDGFLIDGFFTNLGGNPALSDPKVRRALSLGIDRKSIADALLDGNCVPTVQTLASGVPGYVAELDTDVKYDPDTARELLKSAGHENLSLRVVAPALDEYVALATAVQDQWAKLGVQLQITTVPASTGYSTYKDERYDFYSANYPAGPETSQVMLEYVDRSAAGNAPAQLRDEVNDAAGLIPGSPEAEQAYTAINREIASTPLHMAVCRPVLGILAKSDIQGADSLPWLRASIGFDSRGLHIAPSTTDPR